MTAPANNPPPTRKDRAVANIVAQVRAIRAAGKTITDEIVLKKHPQLLPELEIALKKLASVQAAKNIRNQPTTPPLSDSKLAEAIAATFKPTGIHIPGYTVLHEISRGGQGVVYVARQENTGRKVALKVMREGPLADHTSLARFQREIQVLAALNHPNIVTIIDTGAADDGSRFITMNYITGCSLDEFMTLRYKENPADPSKLLRLFLTICEAVNEAHLRGIVHRDLKPSNIRVDERGQPYILDFGLAYTPLDRFLRLESSTLNVSGEFFGSLPWASPEQAEGNPDKIDIRSDVYSLGVILYQMLTGGKFPYQVVGNVRDVLNNILTADPTPPSKMLASRSHYAAHLRSRKLRPAHPPINESIEKIVLKSLSKRRDDRYQSAGELARDIANYLAGHATSSPAPLPPEPAPEKPFPYTALLVVLAFLAFCALIAVWIIYHVTTSASSPTSFAPLPMHFQQFLT